MGLDNPQAEGGEAAVGPDKAETGIPVLNHRAMQTLACLELPMDTVLAL